MGIIKKDCTFCGNKIQLSNDQGMCWRPFNLDNSPHLCRSSPATKQQAQQSSNTKFSDSSKEEQKQSSTVAELTMEDLHRRLKKIEDFLLNQRK